MKNSSGCLPSSSYPRLLSSKAVTYQCIIGLNRKPAQLCSKIFTQFVRNLKKKKKKKGGRKGRQGQKGETGEKWMPKRCSYILRRKFNQNCKMAKHSRKT
ncbi:hypothetical protein POVWA1_042770 [Plasmodium ovale wallikeri]|uniref:Uncharacterized protein n=1 Tax=Plasmodium ovale wallikeri TaxID=864142 RepID=A0A1A8ZA10_PLAOA|nr:hypothetical protein POVWA1_042770 [Plasmodium ovale wallikeri]